MRAAPALHVTLPAEGTSPGAARRHVRAVCAEAGLQLVVDDALLLVTELVTNAVVHAGTELELSVGVDDEGLRVEVSDRRPGGLPEPGAPVETSREGGRGLFLLEALADAWGSTHSRGGKSLWFRLGGTAPEEPARPPRLPAPTAELGLADVGWLLGIGQRTDELGPERVVRELLHRLVDGLPVSYAALVQPSAQGTWEAGEPVGAAPALPAEQVRRAATSGTGTTVLGDALVLPLGPVHDPFGAVVLGDGARLDAARAALARLAADKVGAVLQDERGRAAVLRDRGALTLLAEASEMFAGALDVTLATTLLCQLVVPRFGRWAAVFGTADQGAQLLAAGHLDEQQGSELRVRLSSAQARALATGLARGPDSQRARLLDPAEVPPGLVAPGVEVIAVPLAARRRVLGVLLVARGEGAGPLADDVGVLVDLGRRAALAVEGARLYEERSAVAQALQASLLPPELPVVDGLLFGARYAAAGEGNEVGGDFYDVFPAADGAWAVAIGDVCGKGPEAATITGLARNVLRLMVEEGRTPEQAFRRLNAGILDLAERGRFLTAALALLRPGPDGVQVLLATAGHPPAAVVAADGEVRFVRGGGTLLGVTPDVEVAVEELHLALGEQLVLYTDGVTERRDGARWFGDGTLREALGQSHGRLPDAVAGHLEQRVRAFGPTAASDDLAVLVVAATPTTGPLPAVPAVGVPVSR